MSRFHMPAVFRTCLTLLPCAGVLFFSCTKSGDDPKPTPNTTITYTLKLTPSTGGKVTGHKASYKKDAVTDIKATASKGYTFSHWTGVPDGDKNDNPLKLKMTKDITLAAVFSKDKVEEVTYTLTLTPPMGGTVSGHQATYKKDAVTDITPTAATGYYFSKWTGDVPTAQAMQLPLKLVIVKNVTLGAVFAQKKAGVTHKLTLTPPTHGTITKSPDKTTFDDGDMVTLTAKPAKDYAFSHWTGVPDGSKNDNPLNIVVTENVTLAAVFGVAITLDANGKTLKAADFTKVGETYTYNGKTYTIADTAILRAAVKADKDMSLYITTKVTDMSELFDDKTTFNQDISQWDVSNVTDMNKMFSSAAAFNQDISKWDVSKVTDMGAMFEYAKAFNRDISQWKVNNVTDMGRMFSGAEAFNQDISDWNVSKVTDMGSVFSSASAFNQDISRWDVSKVTDMRNMFFNASKFNQNIGGWDVSKVTDMGLMFHKATAFNGDISDWKVGKVTTMNSMFAYTADFNADLGKWDVSQVTNMAFMFYESSSFNQNIGSWDVSAVTNMDGMFEKASKFNQDLSGWCVSQLKSKAKVFDDDTPAWNKTGRLPVWGDASKCSSR